MLSSPADRIFDTLTDTTKFFVSLKTKFVPRDYKNEEGKSPLYLHVSGGNRRERININLAVDTTQFNSDTKRMIPSSKQNQDINLVLDNIDAKITNIKTIFRLSEKLLTPEILKKELQNGMIRTNFVAFFKQALKEETAMLSPGTFARHASVQKKLSEWKPEIFFEEIDYTWFNTYRFHLKSLGNNDTTINGNIISIKKFLQIAVRNGVKLKVDLSRVPGGNTNGNRSYLHPAQLKVLFGYFNSEFINESYKLILGYFLFACMTGLRISDVQKLTRKDLEREELAFIITKTRKDHNIQLNEKAKELIANCPELFVKKFADQHINDELKKILRSCGINMKVSFHVARHTFATCYLRAGGKIENLQLLLGHSSITQTMIYSHILQSEANKEIHLMDKLF